eukprot:scaffold4908_cov109-Isochrysis_galbana.AAC.7
MASRAQGMASNSRAIVSVNLRALRNMARRLEAFRQRPGGCATEADSSFTMASYGLGICPWMKRTCLRSDPSKAQCTGVEDAVASSTPTRSRRGAGRRMWVFSPLQPRGNEFIFRPAERPFVWSVDVSGVQTLVWLPVQH